MDIAIATIFVALFGPLYVVVALLIWRQPVLIQKRYGKNGVPFGLLKYRTMVVTEFGKAIRDEKENDWRVTRLGSLLRLTNFDEAPQMFNVLKGDMSIIGPRPIPVSMKPEGLPNWGVRSKMKPGLLGLTLMNCTKFTDLRTKFRFDALYVTRWSTMLDLKILVNYFWNMKVRPTLTMITWSVVVLILMLAPIPESSIPTVGSFTHVDKIAHYFLFAIMALVAVEFARHYLPWFYSLWFGFWWAVLLSSGSEIAQSFIPLRNMSLADYGADMAGIASAVIGILLFWKLKKARS